MLENSRASRFRFCQRGGPTGNGRSRGFPTDLEPNRQICDSGLPTLETSAGNSERPEVIEVKALPNALVVELVDTLVLEASAVRRRSSSLRESTIKTTSSRTSISANQS